MKKMTDKARLDFLSKHASKFGIKPDWVWSVVGIDEDAKEYTDMRAKIDKMAGEIQDDSNVQTPES